MAPRELPKELQEKAIKELNEVPNRLEDDLTYIKTWLSQQHYITARTDDQFLVAFLRGCKFSLERTKEKLDMFYTVRTITPEMYHDRDPMRPEIQEILDLGLFLPLPKLITPDGPRVLLARNGRHDPSKIDPANIFRVNTMMMHILLLEDDNYIVSGAKILQDMEGLTMNHLVQMPPSMVKKSMVIFQQAYPNRIKGLHFINTSPIFEAANRLFRPFLTQKLQNRMRIYSKDDKEAFEKEFPKEILPKEYGGESVSIEEIKIQWKKKMESYRQYFLDDAKYKTNEKKRPGRPKTSDIVFGIDGSFRQLAVD